MGNPKAAVRIMCGTCGGRLLDLRQTANGFRIRPRQGVRLEAVFEHDEVRFMVGCWCPGYTPPGPRSPARPDHNMRSYVLTDRALRDAWHHHQAEGLEMVKLGDAVSAGRIR